MTKVLLFAALVACIAVPFRVFVKGEQTKHRYKTTLALNGVMFFGLMLFTGVMMFSGNAFAARLLKLQQLQQAAQQPVLVILQPHFPSACPVSVVVSP